MSSRDYTKHLVSSTPPTNTKVGDEYYDPVTNKLYKKLAVDGTTVTNIELLTPTNVVNLDSPQTITGQKTLSNILKVNNSIVIANTSTTNNASIIYNAMSNSIDFYFN